MGGEAGFRGKSMEKFWIRSAGRNLLSHDNGYIRVAALQGGKDLCYWTRPLSEFFVLQYFLWILNIVKLGFSYIFTEPLNGVRLTFRGCLIAHFFGDDVFYSPVLLRATGGEGSKSRHEEVQPIETISISL